MHIFSLAQILGYVAFVLGVATFLQKTDRRLVIFNAIQCVVYTAHFFLLGNFAASGVALTSAIRSGISLRWRAPLIFTCFFITLNLVIGWFTAASWFSWLPVIGCSVATYGLFYLSGVNLRLAYLMATALWIVNNILSGSIGGTALEFCIFATNGTTILRMLHKQKQAALTAPSLQTAGE